MWWYKMAQSLIWVIRTCAFVVNTYPWYNLERNSTCNVYIAVGDITLTAWRGLLILDHALFAIWKSFFLIDKSKKLSLLECFKRVVKNIRYRSIYHKKICRSNIKSKFVAFDWRKGSKQQCYFQIQQILQLKQW
jgi:hypothetical protein